MMGLRKFISIPHYENISNAMHDDSYYHLIKNSSQEFKNEIHDIYFGKIFSYKYGELSKRYSNPMGVEATEAQVENLFRIQNEFGIEISLTINSIETPQELLREVSVAEEFKNFIRSFYDRGLRSCTIASPHIIRSGVLHEEFPEMRWKNTVNHRVTDAQQVMNYIFCGYDTILLDRSLSRNLNELKRIRRAVDYYNKKYKPAKKILTSLLVQEGCLCACPFKKEHDALGEFISGQYFNTISKLTCDNWRFSEPFGALPRNALDFVAVDRKTFNEFAELTDILKHSGRFACFNFDPVDSQYKKAVWRFNYKKKYKFKNPSYSNNDLVYSNSFSDIIDNNLMPLHLWNISFIDLRSTPNDFKDKLHLLRSVENFWMTDAGRRLEKRMKNCRSQCWDCHECEKTFGVEYFDSALQLPITQMID
jgi:hypothetical protein